MAVAPIITARVRFPARASVSMSLRLLATRMAEAMAPMGMASAQAAVGSGHVVDEAGPHGCDQSEEDEDEQLTQSPGIRRARGHPT